MCNLLKIKQEKIKVLKFFKMILMLMDGNQILLDKEEVLFINQK